MLTDSELESDTSSMNDAMPPITANNASSSVLSRDQLEKRIESLVQENRVLKIEIDTYKLRVKALQEENRELRKNSVNIQARAEQEEEYISNKLLKKIQSLKKEKETLANNYEREEEYLTNDLSRKLTQLKNEKVQLEQTLEQEQEHMVNKLMRKIEKLEAETLAKQTNLEQLRREKIELENTLEQEQESLVNRLWKRMERLEAEKRLLQEKLDQPVSAPPSPRNTQNTLVSNKQISSNATTNPDTAANLTEHIINLRREVSRLKMSLEKTEREHRENIAKIVKEEKEIREENIRLQRRLQMEVDRREALCRHLSESESSLEMDDERHFNEHTRVRTISSPLPHILSQSHSSLNNLTTSTNNNNSNKCPICNHCFRQQQQQPLHSSTSNTTSNNTTNLNQPLNNANGVSSTVTHTTSPPSFKTIPSQSGTSK